MKEVFKRHELKYVIDRDRFDNLIENLREYAAPDHYGDSDGHYTICNLYYDTADQLFHRQKMERLPFRQKVRLRAYNSPSLEDTAFLEIKKKFNGEGSKRRTAIQLGDAYRFMEGAEDAKKEQLKVSNVQILNEVHFLKCFYHLLPRAVVCYERYAFHGIDERELRITFDMDIKCRTKDLHLEYGGFGETILHDELVLMEIKTIGYFPLWLVRLLTDCGCERFNFSKYSTGCTQLMTV